MTPMPIQSLYPRCVVARGYTSIYFGENQLSLRLIRLSLLPTGHPTGFQPRRVRTSTQFNPRFILPMGSSRSFGSTTSDNFALFRLGFPVAPIRKILTGPLTVTRRIIMQKARRHTLPKAIVLRPLVGIWFQVHVPPLDGVLLIFRSLY
jgi:hypothetical protein